MQFKALDIIHDEHRALAAMLNGMRTIATGIRDGRLKVDFALYADMIRYMEEVPERLHHPKENTYLFARLRLRTDEANPILARLEAEHQAGHQRIATLRAALQHYQAMGDAGFAGFFAALNDYVADEWQHMNTEEHEVFPLARKHLLAEDWQAIEEAFLANDNPWQGRQGEYQALFSKIVNMAPAPVGLGGAA